MARTRGVKLILREGETYISRGHARQLVRDSHAKWIIEDVRAILKDVPNQEWMVKKSGQFGPEVLQLVHL